jgi:hypothetical protein
MKSGRWNRERGAGKLAGIFAVLLFAAAIYASIKVIPIYVNNYQFQDALQEEARFAITNRKSPDDVVNDVYKKVQELGLPVTKKDIKISFGGADVMGGTVELDVQYTVPVVFPGYTLQLNFHPHADNHSI